jgi:hypothetical protein
MASFVGRLDTSAPAPATISGQSNLSRYRLLYALLLSLCLTVVYITLIVKIDNTNLQTTNGLWKTSPVYDWEHRISTPVDTGGFLYFPSYGYLSRLIPDRFVSYGVHGDVVTYRKLAVLNAVFGALASGAVFLLALRLTGSITAALLVFFAHASSAFVLLNSLNSEDVIPAYAFFVISTGLLLEYWITRRLFFLFLAAPFFALVTLFHWTLMIPGAAAIASVQIYDMVRHRRQPWSGLAFVLIFAVVIKVSLLIIAARTSQVFSVWGAIYPSKASGSSGYVGLSWEKIPYALIGIANYFCGGLNVSNYHGVLANHLKTMLPSYFYFVTTSAACAWALWSCRAESKIKQMALFAVTLFSIGELEHFYSQPQDPQSQIQPMFITVVGLTILLWALTKSKVAGAFRWVGIGLLALFAANGAANLHFMLLTQGADSQSVKAVKEFAELFPPANTVLVTQGFEGWNTWLYVEVYHGDLGRYLSGNIELANAFTTHAGITGSEAAILTRKRIEKALDDGYRVVADEIWTEREQLVGSLTTVTNSEQARAYYDLLRPAFDLGRGWDTPYGRFVELRSYANHLPDVAEAADVVLPSIDPAVELKVRPDGWLDSVKFIRGQPRGATYSFSGRGIQELFRSDMSSTTGWQINRYGQTGGLEILPNGFDAGDAAADYSSGDVRDHLSSPFLDLPYEHGLIFFSVWAKALDSAQLPELILQQADYSTLGEGHAVARRPGGWVLLAGWVEANQQQKIRIALIEKPKTACLLDKALVVESVDHSPARKVSRKSR